MGSVILWTEEEDELLINHYEEHGPYWCSSKIERSVGGIRRRASILKLKYGKYKIREKYNEENIKKSVCDAKTYKECLDNLGLRSAGGNYKVLQKYINLYDISTDHFETPSERSNRSKKIGKIPMVNILVENSTYSRKSLKERLYKEGYKERSCEMCGQGEEWNGMKISLILDHINGTHDDNRIENLRIVCPNCNAGLPTHCGKNNTKKPKNTVKKDVKPKKPYYCECGGEKNQGSKKCNKCHSKSRRTTERPPYDQLIGEVKELGYVGAGKKYDVSDNSIRKWVRFYEKDI